VLKAATRFAASTPPPKHLDVFQGAPLRLPKPLSNQFPVRVCSCPLCIINRPCTSCFLSRFLSPQIMSIAIMVEGVPENKSQVLFYFIFIYSLRSRERLFTRNSILFPTPPPVRSRALQSSQRACQRTRLKCVFLSSFERCEVFVGGVRLGV